MEFGFDNLISNKSSNKWNNKNPIKVAMKIETCLNTKSDFFGLEGGAGGVNVVCRPIIRSH